MPQGISDDLSDKRIILVATKVSTCLYEYYAQMNWHALIRIRYEYLQRGCFARYKFPGWAGDLGNYIF